jgi:hypothetical protein
MEKNPDGITTADTTFEKQPTTPRRCKLTSLRRRTVSNGHHHDFKQMIAQGDKYPNL